MIKSFEGDEAPMNTLIAHIMFDQAKNTFMSIDSDLVMEINASVIPFSQKKKKKERSQTGCEYP